jgi:hypothetical protein
MTYVKYYYKIDLMSRGNSPLDVYHTSNGVVHHQGLEPWTP